MYVFRLFIAELHAATVPLRSQREVEQGRTQEPLSFQRGRRAAQAARRARGRTSRR